MDDRRIGAAVRALRLKRDWTQQELATRAGTSRWMIRRIEHGQLDGIDVRRIRAVAAALGARLDLFLRWDGGELDRLLNRRHAAMHEVIARQFADLSGWVAVPEVSFSIYGERGIVDILAWHSASSTVLFVELKTEIVDVSELMGTLDRKRRLAREVAAERGWQARKVAAWLVIAESRTNRRRVQAHATVLRAALPDSTRRIRPWLRDPSGKALAGLGFVSDVHRSRTRSALATPQRVGRASPRTAGARACVRRAVVAPVSPDRDSSCS